MAEPESELNTPSSIKVISFSTDVESQSSDGNWAAEAKTTDGGDVEEKPTKTRRWSNIAQGHTLKTAGESIIAGINLSDAMGGGNTAQRPPSSARRTAATESTQLEPVYFGDVVCFGALMGGSNHDGWLRAEGLMVDRVELSRSGSRGQNATNFDFCQFRICPALQHEASDELARVLRAGNGTTVQITRLTELKRNEEKKNERALAALARPPKSDQGAKPVKYGERVQLLHLRSRKFVSARRSVAIKERENLRCELATEYESASEFRLVPQFKFRVIGDVVHATDEVVLESCSIEGHCLTVAARSLGPSGEFMPGLAEVSLSEQRRGTWRLDAHSRPIDAEHLPLGASCQMRHHQEGAWLTCSATANKAIATAAQVFLMGDNEDDDAMDDVVLATNDVPRAATPSMWKFESVNGGKEGGPVQWGTKTRVRHTPSGKYLAVAPEPEAAYEGGGLAATAASAQHYRWSVSMVDDPGPEAEFKLIAVETNAQTQPGEKVGLSHGVSAFRLRHDFASPVTVKALEGGADRRVHTCWFRFDAKAKVQGRNSSKSAEAMKSKVFTTFSFVEKQPSTDTFEIIAVSDEDVTATDMVAAACGIASRYSDAVSLATASSGPSTASRLVTPAAAHTTFGLVDEMLVQDVLGMLELLVRKTTLLAADDEGEGVLALDGPPIAWWQDFARDGRVIDALFDMASAPTRAAAKRAYNATAGFASKLVAAAGPTSVAHDAAAAAVNKVLSSLVPGAKHVQAVVFKALQHLVADNRRSEVYFATSKIPESEGGVLWVDAAIRQVGVVVEAAGFVNTLLSNNARLLDELVSEATLGNFVALIRSEGPYERYLAFFKSICSCNQSQILSNQELCLRKLYLDRTARRQLFFSCAQMAPPPAAPSASWLRRVAHARMPWPASHHSDLPIPSSFLGKDQFDAGFDHTCLSWAGADEWAAGQDALFHSPRALGMRDDLILSAADPLDKRAQEAQQVDVTAAFDWVPIEAVTWAIDPAKLFNRVFPELPEDADPMGLTDRRSASNAVDTAPAGADDANGADGPSPGGRRKSTVKVYVADGPNPEKKGKKASKKNKVDAAQAAAASSAAAGNPLVVEELLPVFGAPVVPAVLSLDEAEKAFGGFWWFRARHALRAGRTVDMDVDAKDQYERMRQFALYFEAQIDLMSEMCLDRSYNSIYAIEAEYSFTLLVGNISNTLLPDQIRASFTYLLRNLYIDRYPHEAIQAPGKMQVLSSAGHIDVTDRDALPQFRISEVNAERCAKMGPFVSFGAGGPDRPEGERPADKFHLVEMFIEGYLNTMHGCQTVKEREANILTLAMLSLLERLVAFGFYATAREVAHLCDPIVSTLDGRADRMSKGGDPAGEKDEDDRPMRYGLTEPSMLVMESKQSMIHSLLDVMRLSQDYRLRLLMHFFKQSTVPSAKSFIKPHPQRPGEYLLEPVVQSKFNDLFEKGGEIDGLALDLDQMSSEHLPTICMDLMMYDSPALFEAAFHLLYAQFSQRETTVNMLSSVQLLETDQSLPIYGTLDKLRSSVGVLRNKVESYEIWCVDNEFSPLDPESYEFVLTEFEQLERFCTKGTSDGVGGAVPHKTNQNILRNLDFARLLTSAITIPFNAYAGEVHGGPKNKSFLALRAVVTAAFATLSVFVKNHETNQNSFFDTIPTLVEVVEADPELHAEQLIYSILHGNAELVGGLSEWVFLRFAKQLQDNPTAQALQFYETVLDAVTGRSSNSTDGGDDDKGGSVLTGKIQKNTIRVLCDPMFKSIMPEDLAVLPSDATAQDYHLRLLNLLGMCCSGHNTNVVAKLQMMVSGDAVVWLCDSVVQDGRLPLGQATLFSSGPRWLHAMSATVQLLSAVYVDTPLEDGALIASPALINLMAVLCDHVRAFVGTLEAAAAIAPAPGSEPLEAALRSNAPGAKTYILTVVMPTLLAFSASLKARANATKSQSTGVPESELNGVIQALVKIIVGIEFGTTDPTRLYFRQSAIFLLRRIDPIAGAEYKMTPTEGEEQDDVQGGDGAAAATEDSVDLPPSLTRRSSSFGRGSLKHRRTMALTTGMSQAAIKETPAVYWELFSMLAVDDPQLTHSSHGNTEMEELVVTLLACGSERPGPASADVMRKMIKHVRTTLGKEISSGYDTTTINIDIFRVLTAVVWNDRRCRELAAEEKLEAHNRAHGKGKDAGGGLLGVMNDLMTMHAQILEDATAITATVAPTDDELAETVVQVSEPTMAEHMASYGMVELVVDVLSSGPEDMTLTASAVAAAIEMLSGEPESMRFMQNAFMKYLTSGPIPITEGFFASIHQLLERAAQDVREERPMVEISLGVGKPSTPVVSSVLRMLQLLVEGHYLPMQRILSTQPRHKQESDLITAAVQFAAAMVPDQASLRTMETEDLKIVELVMAFMVESIQGPCEENQVKLAASEAIVIGKRVLHHVQVALPKSSKDTVAGQSMRLQLLNLQKASCQIFAGLMEGREDVQIHLSVGEKMDAAVFRTAIGAIFNALPELDKVVEAGDELDEQRSEERESLLSAANDLFSLYFQLAARNPGLEKAIHPGPADMGKFYQTAFTYVQHRIRRVEIFWSGYIDLLYFPLPPQAQALTDSSKERMMREIDISSPDAKKRNFLMLASNLVEEMLFLHRLSRYTVYRFLKHNFMALRGFTFVLAVMLNITLGTAIVGPGFEGESYQDGDDYLGNRHVTSYASRESRVLVMIFNWLTLIGYMTLSTYQFITRVYLVYARVLRANAEKRRRQLEEDAGDIAAASSAKKSGVGGLAGGAADAMMDGVAAMEMMRKAAQEQAKKQFWAIGNWYALFKLQNFLLVYAMVVIIFYVRFGNDAVFPSMIYIFLFTNLFLIIEVLDDFFADTTHPLGTLFQTFRAVFAERDTRVLFFFSIISLAGHFRFYFCSFLLLDIATLSIKLNSVITAVTRPFADLALTFLFMIFLSFIAACVGMFLFGQEFATYDDQWSSGRGAGAGESEGRPPYCPNLGICFLETIDLGMRSGDIVDSAMDTVSYKDGVVWYHLMLFSLAFFIIIGVIMMNIVTGITIDTFVELREEVKERLEYLQNTSFVSDIERSEYDELGIDFDFEQLTNDHQDMWNYVYFLAHLRNKSTDDYTGPESLCANQIAVFDAAWMPYKASWAKQVKGDLEASSEDEDPATKMLAEVRADNERRFRALDGTLAKMQSRIDESNATAKDTREGIRELLDAKDL